MQHTCGGSRKCGRVKGSSIGSSKIKFQFIEETQRRHSESSTRRSEHLTAEMTGSPWQPRPDAVHSRSNRLENLTFSYTGHTCRLIVPFVSELRPALRLAWQRTYQQTSFSSCWFPSLVPAKWFMAFTEASTIIRNLCGDGGSGLSRDPDEVLFKGPLCFSSSLPQFLITLKLPCSAESDDCLHGVHSRRGSKHVFSTWLAESLLLVARLHCRSVQTSRQVYSWSRVKMTNGVFVKNLN